MLIGSMISSSILIFFFLHHLVHARGCLPLCDCRWKNGKRTVDCIEKDMTFIPNILDTETQVLDFSGNNLQVLQKEAFQKTGLVNLQKIYLQNCRLHKVDSHAFKGLTNLVELDLSQNYLTVVPSPNFIFFPSLMRLLLNKNPITTIKSHAFQHLPYLNTLELSNCKLDLIENDAFAGLNHLEWLRINGNKLTTIQGDSIFPDTLKGVELQNNRWECNCNITDLYTWLKNFNLPHLVEPVCALPERLQNKVITSIPETNLACLPEIQPKTIYLEINEGKNITLECQVSSIPESSVSWWFQGQILQNDTVIAPGLRIIYYIEEGATEKKSELYIYNTNSEDNGTFSCIAENPAGRSQSNYTIHVLLKEEPVIVVASFSYKYLIILIAAGIVIICLILAIVSVAIVKCTADSKRRKKKESSKDVAMHDQNGCLKRDTTVQRSETILPKSNGSVIVGAQTHNLVHYPILVPREYNINVNSDSIYGQNNFINYSERNPDLVHDAESVAKKLEGCLPSTGYEATNPMSDTFEEGSVMSLPITFPRQVTWQDQQGCREGIITLAREAPANLYQHSADIHLSPGCFLDADGYPKDFGLPKVQCRLATTSSMNIARNACYQTLPHKRSSSHKPQLTYAKDNEFNAKPCTNYETFNPADIRYTADGYPFTRSRPQVKFTQNDTIIYTDCNFIPSPPEGYKSESVTQCCVGIPVEPCGVWVSTSGTCTFPRPKLPTEQRINTCHHIETKCANTQTSDAQGKNENVTSENNMKSSVQVKSLKRDHENCSESPDEGYVGDGIEATDI